MNTYSGVPPAPLKRCGPSRCHHPKWRAVPAHRTRLRPFHRLPGSRHATLTALFLRHGTGKRDAWAQLPTDPRWVKLVEQNISEILTDHAWCEQKAASNAISTIVRYPDLTDMVELTAIAQEEMEHFGMVLEKIKARGFTWVTSARTTTSDGPSSSNAAALARAKSSTACSLPP